MLREKIPSVEQVKRFGRLLGYDGYDEVYNYKDLNYVLLDYVKNGRVFYHVHRFYGKSGSLRNGYNEWNGEPL